MLKLQKVTFKFTIILIIIFIKLIGKAKCRPVKVEVIEGEVAQLHFQYPCDSHRVTLQYSYRPPFYRSDRPKSMTLLPSNYHLRVTDRNNTVNGECSLHLTINPVLRTDQGAYILTPYKNGVVMPEYPRIGLRVDYPPREASCESSRPYIDGEWLQLYCTAPVGSLAGQIVCYQNGMRLPPLDEPTEKDGTLNQIILARLEGTVHCCSSTLTLSLDILCECRDCGWDPNKNCALSNVTDPCPSPVPSSKSTQSSNATESTGNDHILQTTIKSNSLNTAISAWYDKLTWQFIVISVLILINIVLKAVHICLGIKNNC